MTSRIFFDFFFSFGRYISLENFHKFLLLLFVELTKKLMLKKFQKNKLFAHKIFCFSIWFEIVRKIGQMYHMLFLGEENFYWSLKFQVEKNIS